MLKEHDKVYLTLTIQCRVSAEVEAQREPNRAQIQQLYLRDC